MYISKKQFYIITFLFILLPFSVQWRLFVFGKKTKGVVLYHTTTNQHPQNMDPFTNSRYAIIGFTANKEQIKFKGPEDLMYPIGKEVTILYLPEKPKRFILLTFAGLILSNRMIIPGILLLCWFAFYLTTKQLFNQRNKPSGRA
jgi:hypothetical protein